MKFKERTAEAAAKAMVEKGLDEKWETLYAKIFEIYKMHGIEYNYTFKALLKPYGLDKGEFEHIRQAAIVAYEKEKMKVLEPYPGVEKTLRKIIELGVKIGIVTDAPRVKAWRRLVLSRLDGIFVADKVVTSDDVGTHKPDPEMFNEALRRMRLNGKGQVDKVLFVGDNVDRDIYGAKSVGMLTCLARYGHTIKPRTNFGKICPECKFDRIYIRTKQVKADFEIRKFKELLEVVKRIR
jgi:putative hydrolase of the HAD superfamily